MGTLTYLSHLTHDYLSACMLQSADKFVNLSIVDGVSAAGKSTPSAWSSLPTKLCDTAQSKREHLA